MIEHVGIVMLYHNIARSSNGRTPGFGPVNRGSNPCRATSEDAPASQAGG